MAKPLIDLSDDSLFSSSSSGGQKRGLSVPAPVSAPKINLNDDALFFKDKEAANQDVLAERYRLMYGYDRPAETAPKKGILDSIDDTITSVAGTNMPDAKDINPEGRLRVQAEERAKQQAIAARRAELGTDAPDRGYLMQTFDSAAAGTAGFVGSTAEYLGRQFGIKTLEELGQKAQIDAAALTPKEQDLLQKVVGGVGSALPMLAAGVGTGVAAGVATGSRAIAGLAAAGAGTAAEAPSIAQEAYEGARKETGNEAVAERQGYKAAIYNLPLSFITNKLGVFGEGGGRIFQTAKAIGFEGVQEGGQKVLTNVMGYQPTGKGVAEEALVGGLTGGVLKQFTYTPDQKADDKGGDKKIDLDKVNMDAAPKGDGTSAQPGAQAQTDAATEVDTSARPTSLLSFEEMYQTLNEKPAVAAVLYQDAQTQEEKDLIQRVVDRAEIQKPFQEALGDLALTTDVRNEMANYPEFMSMFQQSLEPFVTEMPPGNIFKPDIPLLEAMRDVRLEDGQQNPVAQAIIDADDGGSFRELTNRTVRLMPEKPTVLKSTDSMVALDMGQNGVMRIGTQPLENLDGVTPIHSGTIGSLKFDILPAGSDVNAVAAPETTVTETAPAPAPTGKAASLASVQERFQAEFGEPPENFKLTKAPANFNKLAKAFGVEVVAFNYTGTNGAVRNKAGLAFSRADGKSVVAINMTRANQAGLFVFGHEVFHVLEQRFPVQAAQLSQEIKKYLSQKAKDAYAKFYEDRGQTEKTDSEIAADVMGQMFTDREFWRQVGKKNPSLLERVLEVIDSVIDRFRTNAESSRMQIGKELADYERVREMVAEFVGEVTQPVAQTQQTQEKPAGEDTSLMGFMEEEDAPPPVGSVRKGKPAQQAEAPQDQKPEPAPEQPAKTEPQAKPADDAKVFMDVIGLLLDGKLPQAAKLFKENDLFGKGFGSFTDIQKLAAQKLAEKQAEPEVVQAPEEDNTVNTTYRRTRGPKKAEAVEEEAQPEGQMSLGLGMLVPKETETPAQTRLRKRLDGVVRKAGHINFYNETMLKMQAEIAKIDAELEQLDTIIIKQGDEEQYFRARREDDDRPGSWATYNENAYDFLQDGMIPDKPTSRMDLLAKRRLLAEELSVIGRRSTASRAKLYRRTMLRMGDLMRSIVDASVAGGMKREEALAVYGDYVKAWENEARMEAEGERVSQLANERTESTEEDTRTGLDPNQFDMFDGARVAMGVILDSSSMSQVKDTNPKTQAKQAIGAPRFRVDEKRLEKAVLRGLRDGDFTMQDLVYAFRALNIDISRNLLEEGMELSVRKPLDKHLAETGYSPAARLEWLTNMHKVMTLNKGAWSRYSDSEIEIYRQWLDASKSINERRSVTPTMREADLQDEAFPDLLFNRYTLSEAEGRQELRRVFGDVREVWYQDVAYALRRRPDLASQILGKLGEDKPAFDAWVAAKKAAINTAAEVMGKSPAFAMLRNIALPNRSVGDVSAAIVPRLDSTPTREVEVFEALEGTQPDTAGMVVAAYRQLQKFAQDNGVDFLNIATVESKLRPGEDAQPESRTSDPVVITMNDGQQLEMASRYSGELLNSIVMDGVGRAANYVDMMKARYGTRFYRSRETRAAGLEASRTGLTAKSEIPGREAGLYEQEYIKLANAELSDIPSMMDALARLNAIRTAKIDPETGEILTDEQADERASAFIQDLENRALKTAGVYDKDSDVPAAMRRGETGFGVTAEDRAEQERRAGPATSTEELVDESTDELLNAGVDVEMDNMFDAMNDSPVEEGVEEEVEQTEEGSSAEADIAAEEEADAEAGSGIVRSLIEGLEYRFRRGPFSGVLVPSIVADHIFSITSKWKGAPKINIIPNVDHLPEALRDKVKARLGRNMGAKGLYADGEVYLFSDHLSDLADAEFTLYHEAYGHLGLRAFLGARFDQFLQQTYNTNPEVRRMVDLKLATEPVGLLEAVDEVLSDMAAENKNPGLIKAWSGRIINGLRELGFERVAAWLSTKTDAELAYVLKMAREAAQNGNMPIMGGAPGEVRLAEARLPYEMFAGKGGVTSSYARYNPLTASWAVFTATGNDIRQGWNTQVMTDYDQVLKAMRKQGNLIMRSRSGLYIDFKLASDFQSYFDGRIPEENRKLDFSKPITQNAKALLNIGRHLKRTATINFQNEYKAVLEVIEDLRAKGRMPGRFDLTADLEGNLERRIGAELEDLRNNYEKPLLDLLKQATAKGASGTVSSLDLPPDVIQRIGPDTSIVDAYLTAMHAPERNVAVARINKNMPDGGSGMFTKDAYAVLDALSGAEYAFELKEMSVILRDMSEYKIRRLTLSGMISPLEAEKRSAYDNYVTLSGVPDSDNRFDDSGFDVVGSKLNTKKDKRALGRSTVADDIIARTILSFEKAVVSSGKNETKKKLLGMLEYNYDPDFAVINRLAYKRVFDRETQQVVEQLDSNYLGRKDVMIVHVNGIPSAIQFKDRGKGTFADAIHGSLYPPEMEAWPLRMMGSFNRVIGQMLTTWNPVWSAINFTRDVQSLYFNAVSEGRISRDMAKQMVKYVPKAIGAAFHVATDGKRAQKADQDMIEYYNEMRRAGGATSFLNLRGLDQKVRELERMLDPNDPNAFVKVGLKAAEVVESFNIPLEMAPRIAAYRVMRENGYGTEEAARFAGEITVNFNMRGASKWTRQWFLFFNPAVQGSAKLIKLAAQNPKTVAKIATGMAATGFIMNIIARSLVDEDDDGVHRLDKYPVFKRATTMILPNPFGDRDLAVPIPYGWNAFYAAGHFMADTMWAGTQSAGTTAKRILQAAFESFSPVGSAGLDSNSATGTIFKGIAPTALLPVVEIALNENRFGAPIVKQPNQFGAGKRADSHMAFDSASPLSSGTMKGLNSLTGGDRVNPGTIDINPGHVDHLITSYLPGIAAETYKAASWATRVAMGYETKSASLPLVDRLTAKVPEGYDFGSFRRAKEAVTTLYDDYKLNPQNREKILKDHPNLGGAKGIVDAASNQLQDLREARDLAARDERYTFRQKVELENLARQKEKEIVNRAVNMLMESDPKLKQKMLASE